MDHIKLQSEHTAHQRLISTVRYSDLPEQVRSGLGAKLTDLGKQCETKKSELNKIVQQLSKQDFWPLGNMPPTAVIELEGLKTAVVELRTDMQETRDSLQAMNARIEQCPPSGSKRANGSADHESSPTEARPTKRRRLSLSGSGSTGGNHEKTSGATRMSVSNDFERRITTVEEHLTDLENGYIERENEFLNQIDDKVQTRIDEYFTERSSRRKARQVQDNVDNAAAPPASIPQDRNWQQLEQDLSILGEQVGELAEEVASLIVKISNSTQMATLQRENDELRGRLASVSIDLLKLLHLFHFKYSFLCLLLGGTSTNTRC